MVQTKTAPRDGRTCWRAGVIMDSPFPAEPGRRAVGALVGLSRVEGEAGEEDRGLPRRQHEGQSGGQQRLERAEEMNVGRVQCPPL